MNTLGRRDFVTCTVAGGLAFAGLLDAMLLVYCNRS